ncbi:MAG TPA: C45 family peptidase [Chloroflexota bacterium]|nr:C45 family peptidase [Chloroflexota bacterium]
MSIQTRRGLAVSGARPVVVTGSPREQGRLHGEHAREAILTNLGVMRRWLDGLSQRGRTYAVERVLGESEAFIGRVAPEVLDEVAGIAEGAGLPYRDVLALNVPLYIVGIHLPFDCSQIYLGPPATKNGEVLLAKTRDLSGRLEHVVLHRRYVSGRELVEVNAAGSVTWPGSGCNSDGVAYATSGVWSKRTVVDIGQAPKGWLLINCHVLLRESRSLNEFAQRLREQPRLTGLNIVAGDRENGAAFEATADDLWRHDAEAGVVVRTNHYLTPEIIPLAPTSSEHPSSHHRCAMATKRIAAEHGHWDFARLLGLLGDHDGYPNLSICRHAQDGGTTDTVYASIASLQDGQFWSILDHPCAARDGALYSPRALSC